MMILPKVVKCPLCGGEKEVNIILSGNTCGGIVWSDFRGDYPMSPMTSSIDHCPHCGKYYFSKRATCGLLSLSQLAEAKKQMESLSLTKEQQWNLNREIVRAYNDKFHRLMLFTKKAIPSEEEKQLFNQAITELLDNIDQSEENDLFHAELLRESGRFEEAKEVLLRHKSNVDQKMADAMLKHIEAKDTKPFLLFFE